MESKIAIELPRNEWIALLAAAFYGSNALEQDIGGSIAGVADRLVNQLKPGLAIYSIRDEAHKLDRMLEAEETHADEAQEERLREQHSHERPADDDTDIEEEERLREQKEDDRLGALATAAWARYCEAQGIAYREPTGGDVDMKAGIVTLHAGNFAICVYDIASDAIVDA